MYLRGDKNASGDVSSLPSLSLTMSDHKNGQRIRPQELSLLLDLSQFW
jgi:hypothetical protein